MTLNGLFRLLNQQITSRIHRHDGLAIFASGRAKFEGWLKVELIDILELAKKHPMPEVNLIDIVFQGVALELKTVNTNYSFPGVSSKGKPISKNVVSVLDDIKKLKRRKSLTGFVIFIVFPCSHSNKRWAKHFVKIQSKLTNEKHHDFSFKNGVPGVIYYGQV